MEIVQIVAELEIIQFIIRVIVVVTIVLLADAAVHIIKRWR